MDGWLYGIQKDHIHWWCQDLFQSKTGVVDRENKWGIDENYQITLAADQFLIQENCIEILPFKKQIKCTIFFYEFKLKFHKEESYMFLHFMAFSPLKVCKFDNLGDKSLTYLT